MDWIKKMIAGSALSALVLATGCYETVFEGNVNKSEVVLGEKGLFCRYPYRLTVKEQNCRYVVYADNKGIVRDWRRECGSTPAKEIKSPQEVWNEYIGLIKEPVEKE